MIKPIHGKSGSEVWMQGVDAKRVIVLVDGERVSQSTNSGTDLTQIGLANVEQIEIVKGATSALYGSNAIGGVVNVITTDPADGLSYTVKGDVGSYGEQNISDNQLDAAVRSSAGWLSYKEDVYDLEFSYDVRDSDGFTTDVATWDKEGPSGTRLNTSAEIGFSPVENARIFTSFATYTEDLITPFTGAAPARLQTEKTEEVERYTYRLGGDLSLESDDISVRYFYEDFQNPTTQDIVTNPGIEQKRVPRHISQS
ncbi:TonB-dependent siderophore receptor, partial [Oleiphilus sp. HI0067]|uniref:TonB-dependent receptor plug domain-containing protein n=1 Tax=Oleiphilus sp. HI0067 TaxID=1822243 RepID=UPI0012E83C32